MNTTHNRPKIPIKFESDDTEGSDISYESSDEEEKRKN
jgi:hypothetical protein